MYYGDNSTHRLDHISRQHPVVQPDPHWLITYGRLSTPAGHKTWPNQVHGLLNWGWVPGLTACGRMVSLHSGWTPSVWMSLCSAEQCLFTSFFSILLMCGLRGWASGRLDRCSADWKRTCWNIKSVGSRLVCTFRESVGVVLIVPVMASAAVHWVDPIFLAIPFEPLNLLSDGWAKDGCSHTAATYVILGIATER